MNFQDFKYRLQQSDGFEIVPRPDSHSDYAHSAKMLIDDKGQIVIINIELCFSGNKMALGQEYYFIPNGNGDISNIIFIAAELTYQTFSRCAGVILEKDRIEVPSIPTVHTIYKNLLSSGLKSTR